jgi:hypothetical protein
MEFEDHRLAFAKPGHQPQRQHVSRRLQPRASAPTREHDPVGSAALQGIPVRCQQATDEGLQITGGLLGPYGRPPLRASILSGPKLCTRQVLEEPDQFVPHARGVRLPDSRFKFLQVNSAFGGRSA